jgi:hypothetical protein
MSVMLPASATLEYRYDENDTKFRPSFVEFNRRQFIDQSQVASCNFVYSRDTIEDSLRISNAFSEVVNAYIDEGIVDQPNKVVNMILDWPQNVLTKTRQLADGKKRKLIANKHRKKPRFYLCIYVMATASLEAYEYILEQSVQRFQDFATRRAYADRLLAVLGSKIRSEEIDWELLVTVVFVLTGLDCRTKEEVEWMKWVAAKHGALKLNSHSVKP